jgi:hypothetical protein
MRICRALPILLLLAACASATPVAAEPVDIGAVAADLVVPAMTDDSAMPGRRVRDVHPNWRGTDVYHALYLPTNQQTGKSYPVIVELAGNGGYRNQFGDVCTGRPEGCKLGYGISAGKDFIWVCMPYVRNDGKELALKWWGDQPNYDVQPTVDYLSKTVPWLCRQYGGDPDRVILAGFSRGAIACNYIGLHDDDIAKRWCGMVAYSHYDGVRQWPFADSDRESAMVRLRRLGATPQLICHEGHGIAQTRRWLESTGVAGNFTYLETGFQNHNDAWTLRPSPAREALRRWVNELVSP